VTKPDKVWIKRAKEMKAEVIVNTDAEQKAQSLQEQVLKLVKEAKLKVGQSRPSFALFYCKKK